MSEGATWKCGHPKTPENTSPRKTCRKCRNEREMRYRKRVAAGETILADKSTYSRNNLPELDPRQADSKLERHMADASLQFVRALRTGKGQDGFPWSEHSTKFRPGDVPCYQLRTALARIEKRQEQYANYESLITYREPCPRCGVRADMHSQYGCARQVAA